MIATVAAVLLFPGSQTTPTWHWSAPAPRYGLRIAGRTEHRHPITGETEPVTWTVTDIGDRTLDDVRLNTTVPPGWTLTEAPRCHRSAADLTCDLGPLPPNRPRTITITLIARRPHHSFQLKATTDFRAAGHNFQGPTASFEVAVVTTR